MNSSDSAAGCRSLRMIMLAGLLGIGLVGFAGVAYAQEEPTVPSSETSAPAPPSDSSEPVEPPSSSASEEIPAPPPAAEERNQQQPDPADDEPEAPSSTIQVIGQCDENDVGSLEVKIQNSGDTIVNYTVTFSTFPDRNPVTTKKLELEGGAAGEVSSGELEPGDYHVSVTGTDGTDFETEPDKPAFVDRCEEFETPDDPLQVFVRCENGQGLLTIRVYNLEKEKTQTFTIFIDDAELEFDEPLEIEPGLYVRVDILDPAPDGTYTVRVTADGIDHAESVNVACAPPPTTPTTTTTTPVPQARPAASTGGLADTGASVGGIALLGLIAFGLGGGLLIASRRRGARRQGGTEA